MQKPQPESVTLDDILITEELSRRSPPSPNWQAQAEAMQSLAHQMARDSESLMQTLVEIALNLCKAGTAGVSLLETTPDGEEIFRWNVLAGNLAQYVGGTTPRDFSPCGVCLDRGTPVLFSHPERYFTYFHAADTSIVEGLVLPLVANNHTLGTIWIISHDENRHFDSEDVRIMTSLADFTAAALMKQRQTQELLAVNVALETEIVERRQAEERFLRRASLTHALISNLPGGAVFVVDRNLCYLLAEGKALYTAGFKPEDLVGRTIFEVLPSELAANYEPLYRKALAGEPFELEHNAHDRAYISRGTPLRSADGEVYAVLAVSYDITERKQIEIQLRRAAEMDAFRVKLSDALRSLSNAAEIQAEACRLLGKHLGIDRAYYVEVNEVEGYARIDRDYVRGDSPSLVGTFGLAEYGWSVPYLRRDETIIVADTQTANIVPDSDRLTMAAIGILAHISMPVIKAGELVGALCVTESAPRQWSTVEVELVRETAERIWADIQRARAEAELRESELQRFREQSAREQERQRAESLAELDRAKTLFFSNVSHEFRTPLTLLLAPLQDVLSDRDNPLSPSQRESLELAQRNSLRLLKLVNTLLDFSRIEAGRMEAVYEPTDISLLTTELASVFRSAVEQAGMRLIVDCLPLPEAVYVDREMWEKIVLNLISNAFKFTLEGEISVSLHPINSHVILEIEDTGGGIAPEQLSHLFERFYQARGVQARSHEGSGIGLALVQELVQLQGGTINVSSTLGQGSCFTIAIPFGSEHLPQERIKASHTLTSTEMRATPYVQEAELWRADESREMPSNPRILIVDDNADMREYLTRILNKYVRVEAVADGAAALLAAQRSIPDLILSDVMMPGLDGFGLLQALRADPRTKEVPIILLSARAGEEAIVEGLKAGADDYLIKPFSAQELVSRINAHLQRSQLRGEALQQERTINRRKDELLSTVSHELNTPLVAILGWTRLLRGNPPSQSMLMKSLETIERNATLQAKLIQDLLDISRISTGKMRLSCQPVDLRAVIEMAIATVIQTATAKKINLVWRGNTDRNSGNVYRDNGNVLVMGDRERLLQVFSNLLTNAVKFTPESGSIAVELAAIQEENSLDTFAQIAIADNGIGIRSDLLPHIFEYFYQAEHSGSAGGLGLGLGIARHLVELHQGTIDAASSGIGKGATFTVKLPIRREL